MRVENFIKSVPLILIACVLLNAAPNLHQSSAAQPTGKLRGVILDLRDARVANASIMIENKNVIYGLKSDEEGKFEIDVPVGVYQIKVESPCFRKFRRKNLGVSPNAVQEINIVLESAICGKD